jgi:hypothetical protein
MFMSFLLATFTAKAPVIDLSVLLNAFRALALSVHPNTAISSRSLLENGRMAVLLLPNASDP